MRVQPATPASNNVVDIFSRKPLNYANSKILRIAPELDGLEILYSNDSCPDQLYSLKIVCWGMKESGEVVGMVPWLNQIVACTDINDPLNGRWEGYRDPGTNDIFYEAPMHKVVELETSSQYYSYEDSDDDCVIQEIPDSIGTHAVFTENGFQSFMLVEVLSWRLLASGNIQAMLVDEGRVKSTPVLPGDDCLYPAQDHVDFRYFFQHRIANKIKEQDPEALAAISMLIES